MDNGDRVYQALVDMNDVHVRASHAIAETYRIVLRGRDLNDVSPTLKTTLGVVLEGVLLERMGLPHRHTGPDTEIDSVAVDIKHTMNNNWMFGDEYLGIVCLLIRTRWDEQSYDLGIIELEERHLNHGRNRDTKRTLNRLGKSSIKWLIEGHPIVDAPEPAHKSRLDRIEESITHLTDRIEEVLRR